MRKTITFTLDLEDHRPDDSLPRRYPEMMETILAFLEERNIKATVFTVGSLAKKDPETIRKVCAAGHEIAHHSYDHVTLDKQNPAVFREDTRKAKEIIEDTTGEAVSGYRAPVFSLTRRTLWAVDILKELGFTYSSSILPAASPLYGISGAPRTPFRWTNGLLEIPAPVSRLGPVLLPYLGGFYFRYLPMAMIKRQIEKSADNTSLWTYWHPYDFDPAEKNWRIKGASVPVSLLLWFNRKNTLKKLGRLAENFEFNAPLREQIFDQDLKRIDPAKL